MHALVQDRHIPNVAIREMAPVDEMPLVAKDEPLDTKLGRDGLSHDAVSRDLVEGQARFRAIASATVSD